MLWRRDRLPTLVFLGFPCGSAGKEPACNTGDLGSIPGLGRSPGEGKGYPLQYSGLENSMNCIVHGVTESWTRLSGLHFHHIYIDRESEIFIMSDWLRSARHCRLKAKWPWKLVVVFQAKSKGLRPKGTDGMSPTQIWRPEKQSVGYPRAGEDGCSN